MDGVARTAIGSEPPLGTVPVFEYPEAVSASRALPSAADLDAALEPRLVTGRADPAARRAAARRRRDPGQCPARLHEAAHDARIAGDPEAARRARAAARPRSHEPCADVMGTRDKVRAARTLRPTGQQVGAIPAGVDDLWLNVALSYRGAREARRGSERRSRNSSPRSPTRRSGSGSRRARRLLGDPTDPAAEGHPSNWVRRAVPDARPTSCSWSSRRTTARRQATRVAELGSEAGRRGPRGAPRGRGASSTRSASEHFGFQDGDLPARRARPASARDDFLAHRSIEPQRHAPTRGCTACPASCSSGPASSCSATRAASADPLVAGPIKRPGPQWSSNGSYLVFRRLRQDVAGFWAFMAAEAERLRGRPGSRTGPSTGSPPRSWGGGRAARRWCVRPTQDDEAARASDRMANNTFGYAQATPGR